MPGPAVCLVALLVSATLAFISVDPDTSFFIDEEGRSMFFHGVNVVVKEPPYIPTTDEWDPQMSFTQEDVDFLQLNGFNIIRLGVMFPGTYPGRNAFNETYLDEIESIVNMAGKAGIYSLLDFHQDLLSARYCGEGVPDWLVPTDVDREMNFPEPLINPAYELGEDGNPAREDCDAYEFGVYYSADAVAQGFQCLYDNCNLFDRSDEPGPGMAMLTALLEHWRRVADRFAGNEYVIGYDIINEPFPGDVYSDPLALIDSADFDAEVLQPFYQEIITTIREEDPNHIIFFEPLVTAAEHTGFDEGGPGAAVGVPQAQQAYSFHIYCALQNSSADPISRLGCDVLDTALFDEKVNDFRGLMGVGGIMSEFGAVKEHEAALEELQWVTELANAERLSWIYWAYKGFGDITTQCPDEEGLFNLDSSVQSEKLRVLSYPYPMAVAGKLNAFEFGFDSRHFHLDITTPPEDQLDLETVIFCDALFQYYPDGWRFDVAPEAAVTYYWDSLNLLHVVALQPNTQVEFDLWPES
eukprot:gnl/Chilomastix_cuspidata/384.p1 GENE.gnl/Chilomastix_cuspidata/384~~gnl/Chilomastix_cuspidata/384.p1  ORF type:complete len:533 (-),score=181.80 gnl/Chilomastix_cuspidata/384:1445-3019(-)